MKVDQFLRKLDDLPNDQLITEKHLGAWLVVSASKLQKDRVKGEGPRYVKVNGAVRYRVGEVRRYIAENAHASTSSLSQSYTMEVDLAELGLAAEIPYARVGGVLKDFFATLDEDIDQIVWR